MAGRLACCRAEEEKGEDKDEDIGGGGCSESVDAEPVGLQSVGAEDGRVLVGDADEDGVAGTGRFGEDCGPIEDEDR